MPLQRIEPSADMAQHAFQHAIDNAVQRVKPRENLEVNGWWMCDHGRFLAEEPALAARIPQKDLALYLGITPVALSRIRGRLRHDGADALAKA